MADANKPVRLSKAAREFNLGIGTIVDFLETQGIQVESKPNTKLDPEVYALVRSNFQGDKDAKEAAQRSSVSLDRENISIASSLYCFLLRKDTLLDNQELLDSAIISFILLTLLLDSP